MFCGFCGHNNLEKHKYCVKCGETLESMVDEFNLQGSCEKPEEIQFPKEESLEQPKPAETPAEMPRNSLRQSFMLNLPDEGINLKKEVDEFEKNIILEVLKKTNWVKNRAANLLGLNRTTLVEKLKKMNIKRD